LLRDYLSCCRKRLLILLRTNWLYSLI
jgi:hypothetical protein